MNFFSEGHYQKKEGVGGTLLEVGFVTIQIGLKMSTHV
jgi:hypothetical protein